MKQREMKKVFRISEEFVIEKIEQNGGVTEIFCHGKRRGMWYGEEYSQRVSERRIRRVKHLMVEDSPVVLVITQRRFRFHKGETCRWEEFSDIEKNGKTSREFKKNSLRELQTQNYTQTGKKRDVVIATH